MSYKVNCLVQNILPGLITMPFQNTDNEDITLRYSIVGQNCSITGNTLALHTDDHDSITGITNSSPKYTQIEPRAQNQE